MTKDGRNSDQEFQALTQVLEAEKYAQNRLEDARRQAENILQEAQINVRRHDARTDKRIQALHSQFREKLAQNKLRREQAFKLEKNTQGKPIGAGRIKDVTKRLAQQLVGATPK